MSEKLETYGTIRGDHYTITRPVEFSGTPEERDANYNSHCFIWSGDPEEAGDERCGACDSRPSHVAAHYPCGAVDIPRETILWVREGSTVGLTGTGTVDFIGRDGNVNGVLTPPANGAPVYLTGVAALTYRLNGAFTFYQEAVA